MPLEMFCHRFKFSLGQGIFEKLRAYSITGPHTLRHLKNTHLEEARLNPAEIADVRDAQDRWIMGEGE
jgi:integrase